MLNKILRLERNLAIIDLETTGLNPEVDRICQIAVTIHYTNRDPIAWSSLINPEIPILNTSNHHINDQDVEGKPTWKQLAPALAPKITNVDLCGYNFKDFDYRFLVAEMKRADVPWEWKGCIIDPLHIYRLKRGHTLSNAFKEYVNPKGFENAHDAASDVSATEQVLYAQLNLHQDLPRTVKELSQFCYPHPVNAIDEKGRFIWVGNDAAINFGKHRGKLLKNLDRYYMKWVIDNDFPEEIKVLVRNALNGVFITKEDWK